MLLYSLWLKTPLSTRVEIGKALGISKIGTTHVHDNRVVSDGFKVEDVENALTVERLQEYLHVKATDINILYETLVARLEGREIVQNVPIPQTPDEPSITSVPDIPSATAPETVTPKKKPGRKPKAK